MINDKRKETLEKRSTQWTPGYKNTKNSLIRTESSDEFHN